MRSSLTPRGGKAGCESLSRKGVGVKVGVGVGVGWRGSLNGRLPERGGARAASGKEAGNEASEDDPSGAKMWDLGELRSQPQGPGAQQGAGSPAASPTRARG